MSFLRLSMLSIQADQMRVLLCTSCKAMAFKRDNFVMCLPTKRYMQLVCAPWYEKCCPQLVTSCQLAHTAWCTELLVDHRVAGCGLEQGHAATAA